MSICWDGSPLTVRDIRRAMPDCISDYWDDVLYLKTEGNPRTPVPLGWHVTRMKDGIAAISEEELD